jgi:MoaA/NifB/PqqE/SkfB family radical SAM enzyme
MSERSTSVLEAIREGRPRAGPGTLHVDVTNGCNTNCITCWDHSPLLATARSAAWKRRRVDPAAVEELLDDALALGGLRAVIVSGMGEPFTHPDIYRILAAVKRRGLHLTVITNLVAADVDAVLGLDVDQLLVGVHAASERAYLEFHPSFRRADWLRLHEMLAAFRDAGQSVKHVQVICAANAGELVEMVELGARYRALQVNFKLASLGDGTEACRISEGQRDALGRDLPRATARAEALGVTTNLDVFAAQLAAGGAATAPIADIGCFMGYAYARVLVDGTVLYCCNVEVRVGSLAQARFSELWRGPAWQALRDRMRRGDYLPSCAQCGKLNQNVAIGRTFAARYGAAALLEVTGR